MKYKITSNFGTYYIIETNPSKARYKFSDLLSKKDNIPRSEVYENITKTEEDLYFSDGNIQFLDEDLINN